MGMTAYWYSVHKYTNGLVQGSATWSAFVGPVTPSSQTSGSGTKLLVFGWRPDSFFCQRVIEILETLSKESKTKELDRLFFRGQIEILDIFYIRDSRNKEYVGPFMFSFNLFSEDMYIKEVSFVVVMDIYTMHNSRTIRIIEFVRKSEDLKLYSTS